MTLKTDTKFERKLISPFKNVMRKWKIFTRAPESLETENQMGFFYPKQKMYELKIYMGVICHVNEKRFKIGRGIDLQFQN